MSGRMTELWHRYEAAYEAFRLNVNHPDEWESNAQTFEALTAARQAILDEGLKEYQARVDGLADYVDGAATCEYDTIDGQPDMLVCATHQWMGTCPIDAIRTALAAVRESQVSQ